MAVAEKNSNLVSIREKAQYAVNLHKEAMLELSDELAETLANSGDMPSISDALNAVLGYEHLGFDRSRYGETEAKRARFSELFRRVASAPLGRLALFNEEDRLEVVGATTDSPLTLNLSHTRSNSNRATNVAASANLSSGVWKSGGWNPSHVFEDIPQNNPALLSPTLVSLSREGVSAYTPYRPMRAEIITDVSSSFDLLAAEDEAGRRMLGRFFDQELERQR